MTSQTVTLCVLTLYAAAITGSYFGKGNKSQDFAAYCSISGRVVRELELIPRDEKEVEVQAIVEALALMECPVFTYGSGLRVTWTKQGVDVTKLDSRVSVNQRSGALRIHRAQFLDSGRYTCSVRQGNHTISRVTLLRVVSYPKITLTQNATVARNTTAALLCKMESVPSSHITWKRHPSAQPHRETSEIQAGVNIPGAVAQTSQSEGTPSVTVSQLHFPSVQPSHAGFYICLAANTLGTTEATLSLRVTYAPIVTVAERLVVGWPDHVPDLEMQFKADPPPHVKCVHYPQNPNPNRSAADVNNGKSNGIKDNDVMSDEEDHWKLLEGTEGEITNITIQLFPELAPYSVYGNYSCIGYNSAGETTAVIELVEGRVPQPPEVTIDSQKPTWLVLKLLMPIDMGLPPADRIIARYEDLTEPAEEAIEFDKAVTGKARNSSQHWNLTGLNPGHEYRFSLQLANAMNHSNCSVLNTTLPLYAQPDPVQFLSDPRGNYPRAYQLSWLPPATHGAPITAYTLRYVPVKVTSSRLGPQILELAGTEKQVKVDKQSTGLVISELQEATYYRITMLAHSHVGDSEMSTFIFTTANDTGKGESRRKPGAKGSVHYSRQPNGAQESPVLLDSENTPDSESNVFNRVPVSHLTYFWITFICVLLTLFISGTSI